jgi:MTH538 TIR-like domain (DUF1863)
MAAQELRYDAFISYSHSDVIAARRVQRFLESYRLPPGIPFTEKRLRIFRDATDIRTGTLSEELNSALDASRTLIVCCSPSAASSRWVAQEIDRFLEQTPTRPVVALLLAGDPDAAIPQKLRVLEHRFADLRSPWFFGRMKSKGRDELIRAVATITGADLRQLIPWEKRRRRRLALSWTAPVSVAALTLALIPVETARKLNRPSHIGDDQTIEFCDIVDDRLVLAARQKINKQNAETTNEVQYVKVYSDALNPTVEGKYLDISDYIAQNRLLHLLKFPSRRRITQGLDLSAITKNARTLVDGMYRIDGEPIVFQGTWAAEPRPGLKTLLYSIKPAKGKGADGPPPGHSVIVVGDNASLSRPMAIEGLYPPEVGDRSISARGASLPDGLPIVASGRDIFVGMRIRKDGGAGGLWRWNSANDAWELQKIPRSIHSIIVDPQRPGRVLASTAPGEWEGGSGKRQVAAQFFERPDDRSDWREIQFQIPQLDSSQGVQLCGFLSDGTLYLLGNQALFATGKERLYRRWLPTSQLNQLPFTLNF